MQRLFDHGFLCIGPVWVFGAGAGHRTMNTVVCSLFVHIQMWPPVQCRDSFGNMTAPSAKKAGHKQRSCKLILG